MKFLRLLLLSILSIFLIASSNAQTCTPPNEITILSWTNNSIDIEWTAVPNATQYSIEVFDAASNSSIWFDITPNSLHSLPSGLFNSLNEIVIVLSAECAGIWHPRAIDIYTIPDVWIVYDKVCPEQGGAIYSPYNIRMNYPTPLYPSNYSVYQADCFCPGVDNIKNYYRSSPPRYAPAPFPIMLRVDPEFHGLVNSHRRYSYNGRSYFQALLDYNELEKYFGFHCHGLEPEFTSYEELHGKTSFEEENISIANIYPNPATTGFTFENDDKEKVSVVVYNLIGVTVMQFEVASGAKNYISLPPAANGILYLKLSYEGSDNTEIIPLNVNR